MDNVRFNKRGLGLFLALTLLFLCRQPVSALEVPLLTGRVNDYAGILAPATARQLEEVLQRFEATESTQIVLLTVPSLGGASLEDFSLRVVEAWQPGQHKLDNGALLLIARNDRKSRIEVGYGLEGRLTDLVSGRIIRDIMTPRFREGNFDQGVIDGISAMMAAVKGEFAATPNRQGQNKTVDPASLFISLLVLFSILGRMLARAPWLAAGIGAITAPLFGALALGLGSLWLLALAVLGFVGGLIAASMASTAGSGLSRGYRGGTGGFGRGPSGGFSGGGGRFGGGGASGGW